MGAVTRLGSLLWSLVAGVACTYPVSTSAAPGKLQLDDVDFDVHVSYRRNPKASEADEVRNEVLGVATLSKSHLVAACAGSQQPCTINKA